MIAVLQRQFKALSKDSPGQDCKAMYRLEGRTIQCYPKTIRPEEWKDTLHVYMLGYPNPKGCLEGKTLNVSTIQRQSQDGSKDCKGMSRLTKAAVNYPDVHVSGGLVWE